MDILAHMNILAHMDILLHRIPELSDYPEHPNEYLPASYRKPIKMKVIGKLLVFCTWIRQDTVGQSKFDGSDCH
jgi:hypothetical protein